MGSLRSLRIQMNNLPVKKIDYIGPLDRRHVSLAKTIDRSGTLLRNTIPVRPSDDPTSASAVLSR